MKYVYERTEYEPKELYTVGYYENGYWYPVSDHDTRESAASMVAFLNGDRKPQYVYIVRNVNNGTVTDVYTNMQSAIDEYSKYKLPEESENYINPAGKFALIGDRWQVDRFEVKS